MASQIGYASSIDTATDAAGQSWAAWADNGLIYFARWDSAANRWGDAAAISNATGGRNVRLTAGQVMRDAAGGQAQPALVVTWESGIDNDADVLAAVGLHRSDGTVLWSDAVNLLPGGVAESNHNIGINGTSLILATEAQAVVTPVASGPADNNPDTYHDSEINTYELTLQVRSSTPGTGDPNALVTITGGTPSPTILDGLVRASGISNGALISAQVNGIPLKLWTPSTNQTAPTAADETRIPGLGRFSLSTKGELRFVRDKGDTPSEMLFTAELIGQGGSSGLRAYARSSALVRPSELSNSAPRSNTDNDRYTLSVSTLSGSGARLGTTTVPVTFNASERLERVTAALFTPSKPTNDGSALRDFSSGGRFSDSSLARAVAAANGQGNLARTLAMSEPSGGALPGSIGEWAQQVFMNPYVLYEGQVNRFGITLVDLTNALTGNALGGGIPIIGSLAKNAAFELGLDGLMSYVNRTLTGTSSTDAQLLLSVSDSKLASIALATKPDGTALAGSGYLEGQSGEFSQWITGKSAIAGRPARALLNLQVQDGKISAITIKEQEGVFANDQTSAVVLAKATQQLDVTAGLNLRIGKTKAFNPPSRRNSQTSSASNTNRSSSNRSSSNLLPVDPSAQKKAFDSRKQEPLTRFTNEELSGLEIKNSNRNVTRILGHYLDTDDFNPASNIRSKPSAFPTENPNELSVGIIRTTYREDGSSSTWTVAAVNGVKHFVPMGATYLAFGGGRQIKPEFQAKYQNDFNNGKQVIGEAGWNDSGLIAPIISQPKPEPKQLKPIETGSIENLKGGKRHDPILKPIEGKVFAKVYIDDFGGEAITIQARARDTYKGIDNRIYLKPESKGYYGLDKSQTISYMTELLRGERGYLGKAKNLNRQTQANTYKKPAGLGEEQILNKTKKVMDTIKYSMDKMNLKDNPQYKYLVKKNRYEFDSISEISSEAAFGSIGYAGKPYLFGKPPVRAIELYSAALQSYQYANNSTAPASLQAKRFQLGFGADLGLVLSGSLGWGPGKNQAEADQKGVQQVNFSLLSVQAEAGLKFGLNFTFDFSQPLQPLGSSLVWKPDSVSGLFDYTKAYLPIYENASPALQKLFLYSYYVSAGLMVGGPALPLIPGLTPTTNAAGSSQMGNGLRGINLLSGASRIVSQFPFFYTASDIIFNNLGPDSFGNRFDNTNATLTIQGYANGSVNFLNGLIGGYLRSSVGLNIGLYPGSIGYQYALELGYQFAGITKSLLNKRDSGVWQGKSNFVANTFAIGGVALDAELFRAPAAATERLTAALVTPPIRLAASGGAVVLSPLANLGAALADPLSNGDLALSITAVIQAPSSGVVDANGFLVDFRLDLGSPALALRLAYDRRALNQGPERLRDSDPWQTLINQWANPAAPALSDRITGVTPGSLIPLQIDLRLPKGTDPTSLGSLAAVPLGYRLDGSSTTQPFGTDAAPLLSAMLGSPLQRQEAGTPYQLGTTASGTIGGLLELSPAPYIAAFVVTDPGRGYSDTDFVLEEARPGTDPANAKAAVVRGRLTTNSSGNVVSVAIFQTASATAFATDTYLRLDDRALKARLSNASGGSDAQVRLTVADGRPSAIALATAADGKTALAGSGYLAGGSGRFCQWLNATPAADGQSARVLLQLTVTDGAIKAVSILRAEGQFADGQSGPISLSNSVAGGGTDLTLIPLLRNSLDPNLLDESGLSIGSFQRYIDSAYSSGVDLVYTQGGPDATKAINSSLNLDTPLRVHRKDPNRGWINISIPDPQNVYTPGVNGYNFDTSTNTLFFGNDTGGGMRSVVVFSHSDLSMIQSQRDLYLLEDALLRSHVYASLERKDLNNNLYFSKPQLLSDPAQGGSNSNAIIEPFYAVLGAGVAPVFDANDKLLAAWVHTSDDGQAQIQVRIATATGSVDRADSFDPNNPVDQASPPLTWSPIQSIALPPDTTGDDVTQLSLTYLDGITPVLSWSLNSLTPYQAGVLQGDPTSYYRLNDLPSEGTLASIASTTLADGLFVSGPEVRRFSSWLDTSAFPLSQKEVVSTDGALLPPLDALSNPQIISGDSKRTPLQRLNDHVAALSPAHATAFGAFLGRSGISEQQINQHNNTKARSSWLTTYQQLLNAFAADYDSTAAAIRVSVAQQFVDLYGTRIKLRNNDVYDSWLEQGVADDYDLAVQQAVNTQLGFDFPDSQRQSLLSLIATDLNAAVSTADPTLEQPGDLDLALGFSRGAFAELPNVFLDRLAGLNGLSDLGSNDQPSGYSADLWVRTSVADGPGSILDNGLYNPNATLPSPDQLQLPVRLKRLERTESVGGVETKGYLYTLVVPAGSNAVGTEGLGNNLSPFNLRFAAGKRELSFSSSSSAVPSRTLSFEGADLADLVQYRTQNGKLSSFTLGDQDVILTSFFEPDPSSPGTTKESKEFIYNAGKIGIESKQIPGWSLRKSVDGDKQYVHFNYGHNSLTNQPATLSAPLPAGDWSHVAISYGEDQNSGTKLAQLFIDGQLAAQAAEDPKALLGYGFNLLPYQLGYGFSGQLDELVVNDGPLINPLDQLDARRITRYVDPRSASKATFFSPGVFDAKSQTWAWQEAGPFVRADYIPSTIPALVRGGPVDMAAANATSELRGDSQPDLRASLTLRGMAIGSHITGIRARLVDKNGKDVDSQGKPYGAYAIGDGLRYGLDGKPSTVEPKGLIGVLSSGTRLNSGASGSELDFALMSLSTDLELFFPASSNGTGLTAELTVFQRSPLNRAQGGDSNFTLWRPSSNPQLTSSTTAAILSPYYSSKLTVQAGLQRTASLSLADLNTGFVASLAKTNEPTLADPSNQTYSEAIAAGTLHLKTTNASSSATTPLPVLAIANPNLDGIGAQGTNQGVIWVLRNDVNATGSTTAAQLQQLQRLVGQPNTALNDEANGLQGLVIVGRDGQKLGSSILWADLDRDGNDELILASPRSISSSGIPDSGSITVIRGSYLAELAASNGNRILDLSTLSPELAGANVRVLTGADGSEFGTALAYGPVLDNNSNGNALLIGAPGYVIAGVSTDLKGATIATTARQPASVGAIFLLKPSTTFFSDSNQPRAELLMDGDLPGLPNLNNGEDPTPRRFGASISLTAGKRDFNGDAIADIAIGIPGLVQARDLNGGIHRRATTEQREAELLQRVTLPDIYREGMTDEEMKTNDRNAIPVQMGGVLLLAGGAANAGQIDTRQKVLLLGDTVFGDPAAAGSAVATGGDFDNDDIDDLAIGSPEVDARTGAVSLVSGARIRDWFSKATSSNFATAQHSAFIDANLIIPNDQPNGLLGGRLALNGDVNADGHSDLVIGDPNYFENTGRVSVLFGTSNAGNRELKITGQTIATSQLGSSTYHRLDLSNAETRLDIFPGSIGEGLGRALLLANGTSSTTTNPVANLILPTSNGSSNLLTLYGKPRLKGLGSFSIGDLGSTAGVEIGDVLRRSNNTPSYGFLGDINGDGFADALVDLNSDSDRPRFKVSFGVGSGFSPDHQDAGTGGSSVFDLSDHLRILHPEATAFSLTNVQSSGDLNADAINDLLISYGYTSNGRSEHRNAILAGGDLLTSNFLLKSALLSPIRLQGATLHPTNNLTNGDGLLPGQYLLSPNGRYMALMQSDGNFVVQAQRSDGSWSVSFSLDALTTKFYQGLDIGLAPNIPRTGSTPGTRLEILNNAITFVNDQWLESRGGTRVELPQGGYYKRGDKHYPLTINNLPAGTTFTGLQLTDAGVLEAKASDGTILFSFEPVYASDLAAAPLLAETRFNSDLFAPDTFSPIGTAITAVNNGAPTLLALAPDRSGATRLRWLLQNTRAVDVAALFDDWFASFPAADTPEEQAEITSFNNLLKQELLAFDPTAVDADTTSASNLDTLTAMLEVLAPNAGSSFRTYVEGRSPVLFQPAISLLQTYGDPPSLSSFIGETPPPQSGDVLLAGQRMRPGDYLLSPNGRHMALMQSDGNFVVQALNSQGTWDVSFSLNDYRQGSSEQLPVPNVNNTSIKLGTTPGTSLLLKDGKLAFSNPAFQSADGTNAFALTSGIYRRFGNLFTVNVTAPAAGTSLSELRLGDDGILRAIANDGTVLFAFQSWFQTSDTTPIPDDKLQGLRKVTAYEQLNLAGRDVNLIDRNGDGLQELLIGPNGSDPTWYQVPLTGNGASTANIWFATPLPGTQASSAGSFLWSSTGEQPANLLSSEQAGTSTVRTINGYSSQYVPAGDFGYYKPNQPVATGGDYGVNGASLSRPMLHLGGLNAQNSWGQYSQRLGGSDLQRRLQQQAESFELKVPAYVWQMKSKGDGDPPNQGGDELVLHIGSGSGIKDRLGNTADATINLDGLAISFNEYNSRIRLFWNGKNIGEIGADTSFMEPDGGLHNNTGIDKGYELMSVQRNWFSNLFTTGLYIRVQQQPFEQGGKNYQARLIMELANGMRYLPYESGFTNTPRLNSLNKGLQVSIPLETGIQFNSTDINLNAYGWSGAYQGLHALAGVEFNTDKPIEGTNLQRLKPIGDLNGDGYTDMIGMGSLATGWNYDYALDLPNNNLTRRSGGSTIDEEKEFTLNNGANGKGITRSVIHSPTIVWGGPDGLNTNQLTPIVRGSRVSDFYPASGKNTTTAQLDQVQLSAIDNFSAAANVHYVPLGDVNGDGFDDVAIADYGANGSAYMLYGGTGLQSARSYLDRFRSFLPETRAKDSNILPIQDAESPNIYLSSNPTGFGIDNSGNSVAWINAINLERTATQSNSKGLDPAFGAVVVTKIDGFTGQQIADLSAAEDFNADGLADLFLTSQPPYNNTVPLDQQPPSRYVLFGGDFTGAYTITGTANSDSLKGTAANDVIVSFAGNDIIQTKGGMDAVNAGPGDDQIVLDDDQFRRIDGGSGDDTLILQGQRDQAWDFTKLASASRLRGIESIVLNNYGANAVTLNAAAVRAISGNGSLTIGGDLQTTTPLENVAEALALRLKALDPMSGGYKALVDFASRLVVFNFSNADLSLIPNLLIDSQRDHLFDQLRAFAGDTGPRPLAALRTRLEVIEAAAPPVTDSNGDITVNLPDLVSDFIDSFSQALAFTHSSILDAYQEWFQTLAFRSPETFALLGSQQLADLIALPASWRAAYPSYFNTDSSATPPADLAFERFLDSPNAPASLSEAYRAWLSSNAAAYSAAQLPASNDSRHNDLLGQLSDLQALETSLIQGVLNAFDNLRLSTEFSLSAADITVGSTTFNEYTADGGSVRLLVPDSIAVLMDPALPSTLTPTPPTRSSASLPTPSNTNLEADTTNGVSTTAAQVAITAPPAAYADLRITASEPVLSEDGRFLVFTLHRSGYLEDTTRLLANTDGYIADAVPSFQGQVVFSPGETTQQLRISRMQQLPHEQAAINPYDNRLSESVSLSLSLLPQHSRGPRSTAGFTLNALNAYTPELNSPSRPLPSSALNPAQLFASNLSFQLDSALWMTAESINEEPIRFALDNPQGLALNDIQLLDRITGGMTSIVNAAWAGEATIYSDNYLSPSTDLYFTLKDGGRYDQDGLANGQITMAAAGARTSPGVLLANSNVLRAPSSSGMTLLASPIGEKLTGELADATALWFIPTDDTSGNLYRPDGTLILRSSSSYLDALLERANDPTFEAAVSRLDLTTGVSHQPLRLSNDTNYVAVLSLAQPGVAPAASELRLASLRSNSTSTDSTGSTKQDKTFAPERAVQSLSLTVGSETRTLILSSPYYLVPGLEGTPQLLTTQVQQPLKSQPLHLAWLRVDDVDGSDLDALIRSTELSTRLTSVPKSGIITLTAGDMLLPVVLHGITPEDWVELPPDQRFPSEADNWSLELTDPGRSATPLLQRAGTDLYTLSSGGRLVVSPAPLISTINLPQDSKLNDRVQLTGQPSRIASAHVGFYRTVDITGSVLDPATGRLIAPADPDYATAALTATNRLGDALTGTNASFDTNSNNLISFFAPYADLVNVVMDPTPIPSRPSPNPTAAAAVSHTSPTQPMTPNPKATSAGGRIQTGTVFAFPEANPDAKTFFHALGDNQFALQTNILHPNADMLTPNQVQLSFLQPPTL